MLSLRLLRLWNNLIAIK